MPHPITARKAHHPPNPGALFVGVGGMEESTALTVVVCPAVTLIVFVKGRNPSISYEISCCPGEIAEKVEGLSPTYAVSIYTRTWGGVELTEIAPVGEAFPMATVFDASMTVCVSDGKTDESKNSLV